MRKGKEMIKEKMLFMESPIGEGKNPPLGGQFGHHRSTAKTTPKGVDNLSKLSNNIAGNSITSLGDRGFWEQFIPVFNDYLRDRLNTENKYRINKSEDRRITDVGEHGHEVTRRTSPG